MRPSLGRRGVTVTRGHWAELATCVGRRGSRQVAEVDAAGAMDRAGRNWTPVAASRRRPSWTPRSPSALAELNAASVLAGLDAPSAAAGRADALKHVSLELTRSFASDLW